MKLKINLNRKRKISLWNGEQARDGFEFLFESTWIGKVTPVYQYEKQEEKHFSAFPPPPFSPDENSYGVLGKADVIRLNAFWWWDAVQGCVESHLMT